MDRFCHGDEAAFDGLFTRHAPGIHGFLLRMVHDRALAEDLVQTSFVSLVRSRGRYRRGASLRGWLYGIAANAARDALRHRNHHVEDVSRTGNLPAGPSVEPDVSDPGMLDEIQRALDALPLQQRDAVVLHHLQGLSFPEVAEALGVSVTAAKLRAFRGHQKLSKLLRHLVGDAS